MVRPNFTDVQIDGDEVRVGGVSDEDDTDDILDIRVTLVQGDRIGGGSGRIDRAGVSRVSAVWNARLPVKDPDAQGPDFRPGPVVAFGVETRQTNSTTITW